MKSQWKSCFRICASVFLLYLCIFYWEKISRLLLLFLGALWPLLLGVIIAYVLNILLKVYEKHFFPKRDTPVIRKLRTPVCLALSLITLIGITALVIGLVVPELVSCTKFLLSEIPPVIERALQNEHVAELLPATLLADLESINWMEYLEKGIRLLLSGLGSAADAVFTALTSVVSAIVTLCISTIFAMYLLTGRDRLQKQGLRLIRCYLPKTWTERVLHWMHVFNDSFHRYIVGQCVEAVILGLLCMIGMTIFRFPYAAMIGTLVGFTALIPIAGAYIGAGVGAIMILTESPVKALLFLVFIVLLQQIEGDFIYPRVVGSSIGLPALWVLAAVTVGGSLMGILGMLLGVPIAAALYRLLREDMEKRDPLLKGNPAK